MQSLADVLGALLPEDAIVVDEALTSGRALAAATAGCPRHDWLTLTGGAIGQGLPSATGAAVACPDRPVIAVQADGSAMYTIHALWTCAREQLDVTAIICNNRAYAILDGELQRVGASRDGARARSLLDLTPPDLDFVALATGMGVPASRARTAEELAEQLAAALAAAGPVEPGSRPCCRQRPIALSRTPCRWVTCGASPRRRTMLTTSKRRSVVPGGRWSASHRQARARSRAALRRPTASEGSPKPVPDRVLTSQKTTVPSASRSTRSSSPRAHRQLRASTVRPWPTRCSAASCSP